MQLIIKLIIVNNYRSYISRRDMFGCSSGIPDHEKDGLGHCRAL
jgi:hypothetical protein